MKKMAGLLALIFASAAWALNGSVPLVINGLTVATSYAWPGGVGDFLAVASAWNGATTALQFLGPDGSTWITAGTNTTCTANCAGVFYLPSGQIRTSTTGGTPSAFFVSVAQVQSP